jgi:predicted enzyme related to lactoylglutathione lyase
MNPNNAVGWFEIYVQDMARARAFYEAVLGVKLQQLPGDPAVQMWAWPMDNAGYGASGALVHMPGYASGPGGTLVYFHSADCEVELARVVAAGGQIVKPRFSIGPYGFIGLAQDTEGNLFGIHSAA